MKTSHLIKGGISALRARLFPDYRIPLGVYIHLSEHCNLNCVYCDYNELAKTNHNEMQVEFVLACIKELSALGTIKVNLTGGEPLLIDGIGDIINYSKSKNMFVALSTNGLGIEEKIDEIRNVDIVMLSFDGREETHDFLRGKGTHARLLKAMEILNKNGIKFWTTTVLNKKNINDIEYILEVAKNYGTEANITLIQHLPEENKHILLPATERIKDLVPSKTETRNSIQKMIALKKKGEPLGSSLQYLRFLLKWKDYKYLFSSDYYGYNCWAGRLYCHLYADGKLYACGHCIGTIPGGNVVMKGIKQAFTDLKKLPDCNSCRVACDTENNLIYSLNYKAILNWLRKMY